MTAANSFDNVSVHSNEINVNGSELREELVKGVYSKESQGQLRESFQAMQSKQDVSHLFGALTIDGSSDKKMTQAEQHKELGDDASESRDNGRALRNEVAMNSADKAVDKSALSDEEVKVNAETSKGEPMDDQQKQQVTADKQHLDDGKDAFNAQKRMASHRQPAILLHDLVLHDSKNLSLSL